MTVTVTVAVVVSITVVGTVTVDVDAVAPVSISDRVEVFVTGSSAYTLSDCSPWIYTMPLAMAGEE